MIPPANMAKYLDLFISESREHLSSIEQELAELEADPGTQPALDDLFRHAHSLKGMSASMGYQRVADLAHGIEDVLFEVKKGHRRFDRAMRAALGGAFDAVETMISTIASGGEPAFDIAPWIESLRPFLAAPDPAPAGGADEARRERLRDAPGPESPRTIGATVLLAEILFVENCPLPAARATVALKCLERRGRILDSTPTLAQLGGGQCDRRLSVLIETRFPPDRILADIERIADVHSVRMTVEGSSGSAGAPRTADAASRTRCDEPGPAPQAAASQAAASEPSPSPKERPADPTAGLEQARTTPLPPQREPIPRPEPALRGTTPAGRNLSVEGSRPDAASEAATVRIPAQSLDQFLDTIGELIVHRGRLTSLIPDPSDRALTLALGRLKSLVDRLYGDVMALRLLPFETIVHRFTRSVREVAVAQDKKVLLRIHGREVLMDRSMLDELADPINHLLRNAVDHGIEPPAERLAAGKPESGTISISLVRSGDSVTIRIEDDGRGMDPALIRQAAVAKGFLAEEAAPFLDDAGALMLTTIPGFSTRESVTDISGRGVGMDVVRTRVETLGGRLTLRSQPGEGLAVEMRLPLTIVVVQAFLVEAGGRVWAVPLSSVQRTLEVTPDIVDLSDGHEFVSVGDDWVALRDLARTLGLSPGEPPFARSRPALLSSEGGKSVVFTVDRIVERREIVVKPLRSPLEQIRGFSGATILDDGSIALIMDLLSLAGA